MTRFKSNFKIIAFVATVATTLLTSSAMADCSDAQFRQVGKLATLAVSERLAADAPVQQKKAIKITQCDVSNDRIRADFTYSYLSPKGLSSISGSVEVADNMVVALNITSDAPSLAANDDVTVTNYGPVKLY